MIKKKNWIKLLCCFTICFLLFIWGLQINKPSDYANAQQLNQTGASNNIIQTQQDLEDKIRNAYGSYRNFNFRVSKYNRIDPCQNLSQRFLNYQYNARDPNNIIEYSGTCTEVAATSLAQYYDQMSGKNENRSNEEVFNETLDNAINKEYFTPPFGTKTKDVDKVLRDILTTHNYATQVQDDYYGTYNKVIDFVDKNRPTMFNIEGHSMVGAGYKEYEITYVQTKKVMWWTTEEVVKVTKKYVIVNDGWTNASMKNNNNPDDVFSFFPAEFILDANVPAWLGDLQGASYFNVIVIK